MTANQNNTVPTKKTLSATSCQENTSRENEVSPGRVQRRVEGYERQLRMSTESEDSSESVVGPSTKHEHLGHKGTDL